MLVARLSAGHSQAQEHTLFWTEDSQAGAFFDCDPSSDCCLSLCWLVYRGASTTVWNSLLFCALPVDESFSYLYSIKIKKRCSSVAGSTCLFCSFPKFQATWGKWLIHSPRPLWRRIFSRIHQMTERKRAELWKRKESVLSTWKAKHGGKWSAAP